MKKSNKKMMKMKKKMILVNLLRLRLKITQFKINNNFKTKQLYKINKYSKIIIIYKNIKIIIMEMRILVI